MMAKPMKALEVHYPTMIQFSIISKSRCDIFITIQSKWLAVEIKYCSPFGIINSSRYLPLLGESSLHHILEGNSQESVNIQYLRDATKMYEHLIWETVN